MSTLSQSLISAGAAIVGTLAGSLVTWATFRQSRAERRDDRRREAYAKFIGAAEELVRLTNRSLTVETELAPESTLKERIAHLVGAVERAYVAVVLAGPPRAKEVARGQRHGRCSTSSSGPASRPASSWSWAPSASGGAK